MTPCRTMGCDIRRGTRQAGCEDEYQLAKRVIDVETVSGL